MTKGIFWLTLPDQDSPVFPVYNPAKHLHVTLQFNVSRESISEHLMLRPVAVRLINDCWNLQIQALSVQILDQTLADLCNNQHPHMTISHVDGVGPVKSNEMLDADHNFSPVERIIYLTPEFRPF
jgi:hypothetical protein